MNSDSKITFRPAIVNDAKHLPDIERSASAAFRTLPNLAWLADGDVMSLEAHIEFVASGTSWVAVADDSNTIIGFLTAERFSDELHIWEVSIREEYQGRGVGRGLINFSLSDAGLKGATAATLTTFADVPWNAPFYARLGFKVLKGDEVSKRLIETLATEIEHGLPADRRCAMSRVID